MQKQPLVILTGPTAVGKTGLSVKLAKETGGEIISADSMQVYKAMDIGSAKINPEEMQGIRHHMIDVLEPEDDFNVVTFQRMCKTYMEDIYNRKMLPVIAGGTGFYIQSVLYDIDFTENEEDSKYRNELEQFAQNFGAKALHERLKKVDPASADAIHANNIKRIIRALEFYEQTGTRISEHNEKERRKQSVYNSCYFVLNDDREQLYNRIDKRVDKMIEQGLIDEVKALKARGLHRGQVSMQGLGYKEILAYLDGEISLDEAVYIIKRDTRHFAKRQLTWFRREKEVIWIDKNAFHYDDDKIISYMKDIMRQKGILK